jgi:hypothetical protein
MQRSLAGILILENIPYAWVDDRFRDGIPIHEHREYRVKSMALSFGRESLPTQDEGTAESDFLPADHKDNENSALS